MMKGSVTMKLKELVRPVSIGYPVIGIVYIVSGILINFFQFVLYIFLRPLSKFTYRRFNYYLNYSLFSQLVFLEQHWADVRVTLMAKNGDFQNYFGKEHAFLIMNHSYEVDWVVGWILCDACHILGNVKTFAKKTLQYLPTLGFSWKMGGCIFVERNWEKDQKIIEMNLRDLVTYTDPIWLLLTAEGTRFTKEKHEACKIFARAHGLPELRHHLTPRTKGFATCIPIIRHKIKALYNVNFGIKPSSVKPTFSNILLGKPLIAGFFVERIPMESLPESEAELGAWLHALYKRKDDLLHSYITTGKWVGDEDSGEFESFQLPRRIFPCINFALWSAAMLSLFLFVLLHAIRRGCFTYLICIGTVIAVFLYILNMLIRETDIGKASSYGLEPKKKEAA